MKRFFHISEQADIAIFEPRPSPSSFENIHGDVVFAIEETLMHNYLLPRECPRVTFYADAKTSDLSSANTSSYVVCVSNNWYQQITRTTLYCYEFLPDSFTLLDECAGYYVSYQAVKPIGCQIIKDCIGELLSRNVELRFVPELIPLAEAVKASDLKFSLIRMRNALK